MNNNLQIIQATDSHAPSITDMIFDIWINEYGFDVINDENYDLGNDWQVKVTPTILIIKDGEVKWLTTGFTSLPGIWWRLMMS